MSVDIRLKHSAQAGKVPDAGSLKAGEVAINTKDVKAYIKNSDGQVVQIAGADNPTTDGRYLRIDSGASAQTVESTDPTTFSGQVELPGGGGDTQALQKQEVEALIADPDGPADGNYLKLAADAGDQTVASTGTTTFEGLIDADGGVKVSGGTAAGVENGVVLGAANGIQLIADSASAVNIKPSNTVLIGSGLFSQVGTGTELSAFHSGQSPAGTWSTLAHFRAVLSNGRAAGIGAINGFAANSQDAYLDKASDIYHFRSWNMGNLPNITGHKFSYFAGGDNPLPVFFGNSTYIGGTHTRNTRELWESTLTEEQKEQLSAGTLAIPANVSTPGDGSFARQWWYDQQSAEDQLLIDSGELEYPSHFQAANFVDTFDLGVTTNINLLSNGLGEFKKLNVENQVEIDSRGSALVVGGGNYTIQSVNANTAAFLPIKTIASSGTGAAFRSVNTDGTGVSGNANCPRLLFQRCQTTDSEISFNSNGQAIRDNWSPAPDGALLGELAFGTGGATLDSEEYYVRFSPYKRTSGGELELGLYNTDSDDIEYYYFSPGGNMEAKDLWSISRYESQAGDQIQLFKTTAAFLKFNAIGKGRYLFDLKGYDSNLELGSLDLSADESATELYGLRCEADHSVGEFGLFTNNTSIDLANNNGYLRLLGNGNTEVSGNLSLNGNRISNDAGTWGFTGHYSSAIQLMNTEDWSGIQFAGATSNGTYGIRHTGNRAVDIANANGHLRLNSSGDVVTSGTVNGAIVSPSITLQTEASDPAAFQTTTKTYDDGEEYESTSYVGETLDLIQVIQDLRARIAELEESSTGGSNFESRVAALEVDMARFKAI